MMAERKQGQKAREGRETERRARYAYVIGIIIAILVALGVATYYLQHSGNTSDFNTFKSTFNSAPRVAIYATGYNGTAVSATIDCASLIIEQITGNPQIHRSPDSIDFFAINQTSCVFENGVGGTVQNYTYNSIGSCLAVSSTEPSIFLNYSGVNSTAITPRSLRIYGDTGFLTMCGIASELS